jgi:pimeloyl-ACP methyl ester carboxylesterase
MRDVGEAFRAPVVTPLPTLFVVGTEDGITPVSQTEAIRRGFSRSVALVVENAGHNSVIRPPEVRQAIRAFLAAQPVPAAARLDPIPFVPLITPGAR